MSGRPSWAAGVHRVWNEPGISCEFAKKRESLISPGAREAKGVTSECQREMPMAKPREKIKSILVLRTVRPRYRHDHGVACRSMQTVDGLPLWVGEEGCRRSQCPEL